MDENALLYEIHDIIWKEQILVKNYIFIWIGGFLGAIARVLIKGIQIYHYTGLFPLNTLIINITGSFVLALVLTVALEIWELDESIRLGIATGFLGGYTTFSTLCKETVSLLSLGHYFSAFAYIAASTVLGLLAAYLGIIVAREVIGKVIKVNNLDNDDDNNNLDDGTDVVV
jgi:fluoride exporter